MITKLMWEFPRWCFFLVFWFFGFAKISCWDLFGGLGFTPMFKSAFAILVYVVICEWLLLFPLDSVEGKGGFYMAVMWIDELIR